MENSTWTDMLRKFVQQVTQRHGKQDCTLTIKDLRLSIRDERMSEVSVWSNRHLDVTEAHAARFDGNAPLESVFSLPIGAADHAAASVASICAPSPFAWT